MKKRRLGNTNPIANVAIVMFNFLEWNFELKALFYYTTNFCVKVHSEWTFSLNRDLITEPFFRDFFSIMICDVNKKSVQNGLLV